VKKVKLDEHASDLKSFLEQIPELVGSKEKPILISHSFGGLAAMKYLEQYPERALSLDGIIIMCSVPPSGNGKMTLRFLKRSLVDSWKITAGFAMKRCIQNDSLCRDLFFGGTDDDNGISDQDIARYQSYFARDTEAVIDIRDLLKNLPSLTAVDGKAPHLDKFPPCLVIGSERDFIVDREGVEETATYFGIEQPTFVDSPHDVMLGRNWKNAASTIHDWVQAAIVK
jgi:pimeloyl-ACP methyl ester carboxylesterase